MPGDPYYRSPHWHNLRSAALQRDRWRCTVEGCNAKARCVDHVVSRRTGGSDTLDNVRSLCARHDNETKEDASGRRRSGGMFGGCDASGRPLDAGHWWNRS
jgi:5-methylcytosine-specific restriction endonuclease McrA